MTRGGNLFPLDRRRWLTADVIHHAGNPVHFVDDAVGDATKPVQAGAPSVSIIGRGINGLLQAVMCRLANYQVTASR